MISTAVTVTVAMFVFTYLPQAALLTLVNGPLAFLNTILLVLSESATITNVVSRAFFLDEALLDTFDGVRFFSFFFCCHLPHHHNPLHL
jgi:hypothetical protein